MDPVNVAVKVKVRSFTRSWDNSDCSFGVGLRSNFSSFFTRFRDIAAFVLQHATFSHHTSSLLRISPWSPGSRWMAFGLGRAKANCPCN